jgi:hypothetical protein
MLRQTSSLTFPKQIVLSAILCAVRIVTEHLVTKERERTALSHPLISP